ncbi:MarR family transcriptional regulator [Apilactobacillus micheneri]|uniref:MarR family transcriptional regulator n=1 Tax=Apilactobacillus micheneri TaxID=1899430 RepID=UPI00112D7E4F|nr:MarR family transcriptional regulator [Apilactobacillus micheneri]TPR48162.1 MarR family transcriptional regulator [Apilactobacillus micheneri]
MNNQFTKSFKAFEEDGLNPTAVSILNHLYDYGNLSVKNNWIENGVVFVKYMRETLAEQINVSKDTITRALKTIEEKGWIKVKHVKNAANVYFLTKYYDLNSGLKKQNATTGNANCNMNQTNFKHTKDCVDTSVTEMAQKGLNNKSVSERPLEIINDKSKSTVTVSDYDLRTKLYRSLQDSVGMSWDLVYTIDKFTDGYQDMKTKVGIIFKTKKAAKNRLIKLGYLEASECLSFEDNHGLSEELRGAVFDAMTTIRNGKIEGKTIKDKNAFFAGCLYKFFDRVVDDESMALDDSKINGVNRKCRTSNFNIPIIQLDK